MANDYRDRNRSRGGGYPGGDYNEPGYGRYGGYRGENFFGGGSDADYGPRGYSDLEGDRGYERRPSYRGRGPKNYQRSDERIHEDVCERLAYDDDVDATEIEVTVNGATVTLAGTVHDRYAKRRAEDIAESVTGVKEVQNQIRIARE